MKKLYKLFENFPQLELENYILRKLKDLDFTEIFEIYSDAETIKYEGIEPIETEEQSKKYIENILNGYKNKFFIRWGIEDKTNKQIIGLIALHHIDYKNFSSQIGYILNRRYWHKNIMNQSLNEVISFIFNNTEIHRLEVSIHPDNISSIKLAEKLGFLMEGLLRHSAYNKATETFEDRIIMGLVNN